MLEKTRAAVADQLQPGETILAAAKAQLDMKVLAKFRKDADAGSWADAPGVKLTPPIGSDPRDLAKVFGTGVVVAVTEKRILLIDVTAVASKPRLVMVSIDRDAAIAITGGTRRIYFIKIRWILMSVPTPIGDAVLGFEVPNVAAKDADAVLAELGVGD
jgi:hypothetical protein